jgi:hypothetical protein
LVGQHDRLHARDYQRLPFLLPLFIPVFAPSMISLILLTQVAGENDSLALDATRLPNNVTTEMTWRCGKRRKPSGHAGAASLFEAAQASALAQQYLDGRLPPAAQAAIAHFMQRYSARHRRD